MRLGTLGRIFAMFAMGSSQRMRLLHIPWWRIMTRTSDGAYLPTPDRYTLAPLNAARPGLQRLKRLATCYGLKLANCLLPSAFRLKHCQSRRR